MEFNKLNCMKVLNLYFETNTMIIFFNKYKKLYFIYKRILNCIYNDIDNRTLTNRLFKFK